MADHERFLLRVTAGPSYDPSSHQPVLVNTSSPITISSEHIDASINVRIQSYRGLPRGSPISSPYFDHPKHKWDRYSIAFSFVPKTSLSGDDVVFGNDFDHPIRDRLPPGFGTAFRIVKWAIDPGLDGDVYAEEPYLYGPLLSSINIFSIGEKGQTTKEDTGDIVAEGDEQVVVLEEGAEGDGSAVREEANIPADPGARKKFFLTEAHRKAFEFEEGRAYLCDFFNPYLDFNEFALRLPGFTLPIIKYWDGQPLRYVLKNRATGKELFVIVFTLVPKEQVESDESSEKREPAASQKMNGPSFEDEGVD